MSPAIISAVVILLLIITLIQTRATLRKSQANVTEAIAVAKEWEALHTACAETRDRALKGWEESNATLQSVISPARK